MQVIERQGDGILAERWDAQMSQQFVWRASYVVVAKPVMPRCLVSESQLLCDVLNVIRNVGSNLLITQEISLVDILFALIGGL